MQTRFGGGVLAYLFDHFGGVGTLLFLLAVILAIFALARHIRNSRD